MQSRTHTCGQLRLSNAGEKVTLCGWMENVRVVGQNFAFVVLRDFYGTTQIVVETEAHTSTTAVRVCVPERRVTVNVWWKAERRVMLCSTV